MITDGDRIGHESSIRQLICNLLHDIPSTVILRLVGEEKFSVDLVDKYFNGDLRISPSGAFDSFGKVLENAVVGFVLSIEYEDESSGRSERLGIKRIYFWSGGSRGDIEVMMLWWL